MTEKGAPWTGRQHENTEQQKSLMRVKDLVSCLEQSQQNSTIHRDGAFVQ